MYGRPVASVTGTKVARPGVVPGAGPASGARTIMVVPCATSLCPDRRRAVFLLFLLLLPPAHASRTVAGVGPEATPSPSVLPRIDLPRNRTEAPSTGPPVVTSFTQASVSVEVTAT